MIPQVKLADFGSSVILGPGEQVSQIAGTLDYSAPEVLSNNFYSKEVDIWGLGVALYVMLSGEFLTFPETSLNSLSLSNQPFFPSLK